MALENDYQKATCSKAYWSPDSWETDEVTAFPRPCKCWCCKNLCNSDRRLLIHMLSLYYPIISREIMFSVMAGFPHTQYSSRDAIQVELTMEEDCAVPTSPGYEVWVWSGREKGLHTEGTELTTGPEAQAPGRYCSQVTHWSHAKSTGRSPVLRVAWMRRKCLWSQQRLQVPSRGRGELGFQTCLSLSWTPQAG